MENNADLILNIPDLIYTYKEVRSMKLKLFLLLVLGIFSFASPTLADTKLPLFVATSDAFTGNLELDLTVDVNTNVTGLTYTENGKETPVSPTQLASGIVLYQTSGKDVAVLSGQNFSVTTGGPLTLKYLYDGLSGTYQNFDFALSRQSQSWNANVTDSNGIPQNFTTMYLTANKLLGKIIGIESITVR